MLENPECSGTEQNGTERNGTGSNWSTIQTWTPIRIGKLVLICQLISHPVPATKAGQAPSRQYRATPSVLNILAVYLVSSSGVADPWSEGSAMSLSSLGSAVGSGVTCGSPWNMNSIAFCVLYSLQIRNKHHHRASAFTVNIRQARIAVGSAVRCYQYIYSSVH